MEEKLKQRLVGALVLIALAVIFLPSLFQREEKVVIDTTRQIPAAPTIAPVVVSKPNKPEGVENPSADQLFQPEVEPEPLPSVEAVPSLTTKKVPAGWVIQVASLSQVKAAETFTDQLQKAGYPAYFQPVTTDKGTFVRILVGPYINQADAKKAKREIDKTHKVKSQILRFNPKAG